MQPTELTGHPEGGRFQEVFRSKAKVIREDGLARTALTHIYFSLNKEEFSRFHRVKSDEVWNLYQGAGLYLYTWDGSSATTNRVELSAASNSFCSVVPAGHWQAAEPIDGKVLVGCSVGPGFEFADFELINPNSVRAQELRSDHPALSKFIVS